MKIKQSKSKLRFLVLIMLIFCLIDLNFALYEEEIDRKLAKSKKPKKKRSKNKRSKNKRSKNKRKKGRKKKKKLKKIKGLPYPYRTRVKDLDQGIYWEEPEIHVSNAPSLQMSYSKRGEKLRNRSFYPKFHKNPNINYFYLKFPTYDPNEPRIIQIQSYINYWMNINEKTESAKVKFKIYNEEECLNRVEISYFNQDLKISKTYYIDVRFMPEKIIYRPILKRSKKIYIAKNPIKYYGENLNITENYDCKLIRKKLGRPRFFNCNPYIYNNVSVPKTYTVDAQLKGKLVKNILFTIKQFVLLPSEELSPDIVNLPTISNPTLLKYILEAVRGIKSNSSNYRYKSLMFKSLSTEDFVKRISAFDDVLDEFAKLYKGSQKNVGDGYQTALKNNLMDKKKTEFNQEKEDMINFHLLQMYSKQITSFQLKKAEKKVMHHILNNGELKTYLIRSKRAITNRQISDVYNYLDYLRYYKDQRLEKKILGGFAKN